MRAIKPKFRYSFPDNSYFARNRSYHGVMALILFVGYAIVCIYNMRVKEKQMQINLLWLLATGIGVQFGWEAALLLCGIRPAGIAPLIVNSLIETNLGIPYIYFIQKGLYRVWDEDLSRVPRGGQTGKFAPIDC